MDYKLTVFQVIAYNQAIKKLSFTEAWSKTKVPAGTAATLDRYKKSYNMLIDMLK